MRAPAGRCPLLACLPPQSQRLRRPPHVEVGSQPRSHHSRSPPRHQYFLAANRRDSPPPPPCPLSGDRFFHHHRQALREQKMTRKRSAPPAPPPPPRRSRPTWRPTQSDRAIGGLSDSSSVLVPLLSPQEEYPCVVRHCARQREQGGGAGRWIRAAGAPLRSREHLRRQDQPLLPEWVGRGVRPEEADEVQMPRVGAEDGGHPCRKRGGGGVAQWKIRWDEHVS